MPDYIDKVERHQNMDELNEFASYLSKNSVRRYLEIGSKYGCSLWHVMMALESDSSCVAVDMPNGTRDWSDTRTSLVECIEQLNQSNRHATAVWGDSTTPQVIQQVRGFTPFDAVLIDANHTTPFLRADWTNYGDMARIVAFHDISWHRAPDWKGTRIDVPEFWEQLRLAHPDFKFHEIRRDPTGKSNGIGIVERW